MDRTLARAMAQHQKGELGTARGLYEQILARAPTNADAMHLLGVVHHQRGEHGRAAEMISHAIALRPEVAAFHVNLAEVYRALKQPDRAIGCCQTALRLHPNLPAALHNLGLALQESGHFAEAVESFRRELQVQPNSAPVHNALGVLLRQLGRMDEALAHFQRAVALAPQDFLAQINLGQMYLSLGRSEKAIAPCREAVRLHPQAAMAYLVLGDALRLSGQFDEAQAAYQQALALQPKLAAAHANLGLLLRAQQKEMEALASLQQAVSLEPGNPHFWRHLAEWHTERDAFAEAVVCWERAVALHPANPTLLLGLGSALVEAGRFREAETHLHSALRLRPDSAAPHFGLACLHEQRGDMALAEESFRTALRLEPTFTMALERLVRLVRGRLSPLDNTLLATRLADPHLSDRDRIKLLFAQTTVLDQQGDHAGAAASVRQAHALRVEQAHRQHRAYDPEGHRRFVARLIEVCSPQWFARLARAGVPTQRPVFIVGLPRSGTTLVEQILASHPRVHGAGELRLVGQLFQTLPATLGREGDPLTCLAALDAPTIQRLSEFHLSHLAALDGGRTDRITDKFPENYLYLGLLAVLFPRATFVHCRRDLRDVAVSCWLTNFRWLDWTHDLEHLVARFHDYLRLMAHWRRVLPVPLHEVSYEDVVGDLEGSARRLVGACGLEWDPRCLDFHRTQRPVRTASSIQVRTPLYRQSLGRWHHYEHELGEVFARLANAEAARESSAG